MTFSDNAWLVVIGGAIALVTSLLTGFSAFLVSLWREAQADKRATEGRAALWKREDALLLRDQSRLHALECLGVLSDIEQKWHEQAESVDWRATRGRNPDFDFPPDLLRKLRVDSGLIESEPVRTATENAIVVINGASVLVDTGEIEEAATWFQRRVVGDIRRVISAYLRGDEEVATLAELADLRRRTEDAYSDLYGN
jgi:hypothetical protein